jgi:hypothetical protein
MAVIPFFGPSSVQVKKCLGVQKMRIENRTSLNQGKNVVSEFQATPVMRVGPDRIGNLFKIQRSLLAGPF